MLGLMGVLASQLQKLDRVARPPINPSEFNWKKTCLQRDLSVYPQHLGKQSFGTLKHLLSAQTIAWCLNKGVLEFFLLLQCNPNIL